MNRRSFFKRLASAALGAAAACYAPSALRKVAPAVSDWSVGLRGEPIHGVYPTLLDYARDMGREDMFVDLLSANEMLQDVLWVEVPLPPTLEGGS